MPSDNEYLTYILELLREVDGITFKKMMGEFILYKNGAAYYGATATINGNDAVLKGVDSSSILLLCLLPLAATAERMCGVCLW